MEPFLIDPHVVDAFLAKSYALKDAWDMVAHTTVPAPAPGELFYTPAERDFIIAEAERLYTAQIASLPQPTGLNKVFKLSAGAPGAGKTTLLEHLMASDPSMKGLLFVDPDESALKRMDAYHADLKSFGGGSVGLALSYTKWRWASNYISNTIMNRGCREGRDILLGTTATSPRMGALYENAHKAGYESETIIVCASDAVRHESDRRRFEVEGTRFTSDAREKGVAFYECLASLFGKTKDFRLYWRGLADGAPVQAARGVKGQVTVYDRSALDAIDRDLQAAKPGLSWPALQSAYQSCWP